MKKKFFLAFLIFATERIKELWGIALLFMALGVSMVVGFALVNIFVSNPSSNLTILAMSVSALIGIPIIFVISDWVKAIIYAHKYNVSIKEGWTKSRTKNL